MSENMTVCPTCNGSIAGGTTMFTVKIGNGILLLEDVPAEICSLCGEKWFSDSVMDKIESIANDVRKRHIKFEIITFNAA
jgi:YgiT-type zinc finger domain-containing protein